MKIRCLAIDDEPLAVKKIAGYIEKVPFLELVAECRSASEAMGLIDSSDIQLLFIDINMPDISGMEFVKALTTKPYIVFTTAYSEYAVEGFEVEAVDYLLKPISFSNFLKAANKVKNRIDLEPKNPSKAIPSAIDHLYVKSNYKLIRIDLDNIRYVESQHEYSKIILMIGVSILTKVSLKAMAEQLPANRFMRVHRSYIVSLSEISVVERNRIIIDGKLYIPVGDQYKETFQKFIDKMI
jgi:two-component system, LytTR family, response regulator LytT